MKKIYISGKIDGCEPRALVDKFSKAETEIRAFQLFECHIINPIAIEFIPNGTWQDYMERDLIYLKHCDAIYMLRDWKDSAGARVEHEFAKKLGLEIIYEEEQQ